MDNADAMPTNQTGLERQKIPFSPSRFQYFFSIYAHHIEKLSEFVDKRNVEVALSILNHFSGFGNFYRRSQESSGSDDGLVKSINFVSNFGCGTGSNFFNFSKV